MIDHSVLSSNVSERSIRPHRRRQFASDNRSGICPEAWNALERANRDGHDASYGEDIWTRRAADQLRDLFATDCDVYFVFNGTAANSLALASLCQSYHSVICHETAHIETDECGAPEFFSNGTKLLLAGGTLGKVDPTSIENLARKRDDIHFPKPRVLSLTQATELGTLYSPVEIAALGNWAKSIGLSVHMDGARFANAVASLDCHPAEITWRAGVDVLCFGGSKNGMSCGEAVIFFNRSLSNEFAYRCKQAGQLASKMRFLAAQWVGVLEDRAWITHAAHANAMAKILQKRLAIVASVRIMHPVQSNAVFASLSEQYLKALDARGWDFYSFIGGSARFMCSWDTTEADIDDLIGDILMIEQQIGSSSKAMPL